MVDPLPDADRPPSIPHSTRGAYGVRLTSVDGALPLLVDAPDSWPEFAVAHRIGRAGPEQESVTDDHAVLNLRSGGAIHMDRAAGEAMFILPRRVETAEIIHPLLAPVGAVVAYWEGRESFHAGAFVTGGRAWGVIGQRGAGKSTTMARLAVDGVAVLSDDLLVIDGGHALAGPRSVDLRERPARHLAVGVPLGVVGSRERWRLPLESIASSVELAGWVFLAWGERVECVRVPARERIRRLQSERGIRVQPRHPSRLVELAALPAWELRRPRSLDFLDEAASRLLAVSD